MFSQIAFIQLAVFLMSICGMAIRSTYGQKPNIVFIMADDLGYGDLGCYGQKLIRTPNIDRLASEGMRFTQAYSGGSVCVPARAVLMTGLHNGHAPARDNVPHYHTYLQQSDVTVAKLLKQAGYHTGGVGKWSLGMPIPIGKPCRWGSDGVAGILEHFLSSRHVSQRQFAAARGVPRTTLQHWLKRKKSLDLEPAVI